MEAPAAAVPHSNPQDSSVGTAAQRQTGKPEGLAAFTPQLAQGANRSRLRRNRDCYTRVLRVGGSCKERPTIPLHY